MCFKKSNEMQTALKRTSTRFLSRYSPIIVNHGIKGS